MLNSNNCSLFSDGDDNSHSETEILAVLESDTENPEENQSEPITIMNTHKVVYQPGTYTVCVCSTVTQKEITSQSIDLADRFTLSENGQTWSRATTDDQQTADMVNRYSHCTYTAIH